MLAQRHQQIIVDYCILLGQWKPSHLVVSYKRIVSLNFKMFKQN